MPRDHVLVLDSNADFIAFLEDVFSETRFKFVTAPTFKEAFSTIKSLAPSLALVVLDFDLATDDIEILERQRRLDFDEPIPVLILGNVLLTSEEIVQLCKDSGYTGYVSRQMSREDWVQVVETMALGEDRKVFFPVDVRASFQGQMFQTECFSLSVRGAFIRLTAQYPDVGTVGSLGFLRKGETFLEVKSEVVFVRPFQANVLSVHPSGIALKFLDLPSRERQLLETLIRRKIETDQEE